MRRPGEPRRTWTSSSGSSAGMSEYTLGRPAIVASSPRWGMADDDPSEATACPVARRPALERRAHLPDGPPAVRMAIDPARPTTGRPGNPPRGESMRRAIVSPIVVLLGTLAPAAASAQAVAPAPPDSEPRWFKGNLHTH